MYKQIKKNLPLIIICMLLISIQATLYILLEETKVISAAFGDAEYIDFVIEDNF